MGSLYYDVRTETFRKIPTKKFYVVMTDKFMSGWGKAAGKINKLVIGVNTHEQAVLIRRNAKRRKEMRYVNISKSKPNYDSRHYLVSYMDFSELSGPWIVRG